MASVPGQVGSAYRGREAYRVGYEARRAARAARIANLKSGARAKYYRSPSQSARTVFGLLGGLFILLGVMALLLPGFGGPASPFVCLAPGIALLIPWLLWRRDRSRMPAAQGRPGYPSSSRDTGRTTRVGERGQASSCSECVNSAVTACRAVAAPGEHIRAGSIVLSRAGGRVSASFAKRHPQPAARPPCRRDVAVVKNLQQWEERVGELADRLTTFERDAIIQREIKEVPANITRLRGQIESEGDHGLHAQNGADIGRLSIAAGDAGHPGAADA